jgi:integrase
LHPQAHDQGEGEEDQPGEGSPQPAGEGRRALLRNAKRDPLFYETTVTKPVDFHSFRRAFSTALADAGVNAQQAMRLASHSDEKTHMRYVMTTPAMKQIPGAAVPKAFTSVAR